MAATAVQRYNATQDYLGNKLINVGAPTAAGDATNKAYVDALSNGTSWKAAVRAAATSDVNLASPGAIDGVTIADGDRVLLMGQTDGTENGIYTFTGGNLVRATDADTATKLGPGSIVTVEEGGAQGDKTYVLITNGPITLGSTALAWTLANNNTAATYTGGNGINVNGSHVVAAVAATNGGIQVGGSGISVVAGTAITVDAGGVSVHAATDAGLYTGPGGVGIDVSNTGALVTDANGLNVVADPAGGILVGGAGLAVVADAGIAVTASGVAVAAGDGITVGAGGVTVAPKTNGGIAVDAGGVSVHAATDAGLYTGPGGVGIDVSNTGALVTDANGLNVVADPAGGILVGGAGLAVVADAGIAVTASGVAVHLAANKGLSVDSNGLAVVAGDGIQVGAGGVAVDTTVARVYSEVVGDGVTDTFTINHQLGKRAVLVQVFDNGDGVEIGCGIARDDANNVSLAFGVAPTSGEYTVVISG